MKQLFIILLSIMLFSCNIEETNIKTTLTYKEFGKLLTDCKGYGVVVTTGINEGNFAAYKYYIVIKDSTGTCREYVGAQMNVTKGDTLIKK